MACNHIALRREALIQQLKALAAPRATPMLLAVTKQQPEDRIEALLASGHRQIAENRVAEASMRWGSRRAHYPDLELHLIGALQTNKAREAVALFDVIQTLDRPRLADAINQRAGEVGKRQRCMIQVNIGSEPQKSGVEPDALESLYIYCASLPNLTIEGLMCIPPAEDDPTPYFEQMRALAVSLSLSHLSMGMSGDFVRAVQSGATHVRIGTTLMGERQEA